MLQRRKKSESIAEMSTKYIPFIKKITNEINKKVKDKQ